MRNVIFNKKLQTSNYSLCILTFALALVQVLDVIPEKDDMNAHTHNACVHIHAHIERTEKTELSSQQRSSK